MSSEILERIADGRTDLVFEYLANGHPAKSTDQGGVFLFDEFSKRGRGGEGPTQSSVQPVWRPVVSIQLAAWALAHLHWQLPSWVCLWTFTG